MGNGAKMDGSVGYSGSRRRLKLSFVLGMGLVVCLSCLVVILYRSQTSLHRQLVEDLRKEMIIRTGPVEYFFQERLNDLRDLMESHSLAHYLANTSLGLGAECGLKDSLLPMERELNKTLTENLLTGRPIYNFIGFIDSAGRLAAKSGRRDLGLPLASVACSIPRKQ